MTLNSTASYNTSACKNSVNSQAGHLTHVPTMNLSDYRNEYTKGQLKESDLDAEPRVQFQKWLDEAMQEHAPEPTAMTLSTVNAQGQPTARIVLLKGYDEHGLAFYTNYSSRKGQELEQNPQACLSFFWPTMQRQVRFEGRIQRMPRAASEQYFQSRPHASRISAWASPQSEPISAEALQERFEHYLNTLGSNPDCPPHWGGYYLQPDYIEFWQGGRGRLNDRFAYQAEKNHWHITRLAP